MKRLPLGALVLTLFVPGMAAAQIKTLPGEMVTAKAKVEAIEQASRTLNLRLEDGTLSTIIAPAAMTKFSEIKVGDTVTAKYYDTISVRKKEPGEADVNKGSEGLTGAGTVKPAGTAATQRTITAAVTAIDMKIPSVTLKGPKGWTYSSRVADKAALAKLQVGDRVDITWTEALLVSVEPPK